MMHSLGARGAWAALVVLLTNPGVASAGTPTPDVGAHPTRAEAASPTRYAQLLARYVHIVSSPGEPLLTRFDYGGLRGSSERKRTLDRVRQELLAIPPAKMTPRERLAWGINTYNFLVLWAVTEHLEDARKDGAGPSVLNIAIGGRPFFEAPLVVVEGDSYSLNAFERRFVFLDFDPRAGKAPPATLEPRAHFALVCGAKGCPPLLPRPYTADSLDTQLDFVTRAALASPVHLHWNHAPPGLEASSVFDWYAGDFGGPDRAFAFLLRHAPAAARDAIAEHGIEKVTAFIEWDWSLNQTPAP